MSPNSSDRSVPLHFQLAAFSITRTVTNTGYRMIYPFLPAIARGLGVDLTSVSLIVSARSTLGLFSPLFGSLADRWGRKIAMLLGLALFAGSMLVISIWTIFPVFFLSMLLAAVGKYVFDSAMYAYLGDAVAYDQRGQAAAIAELSWSLAFLAGMPALGWMIEQGGLAAPFPWLAALGLIGIYALWKILPNDAPDGNPRPKFLQSARIVLAHRAAVAGLLVGLIISTANELVSIVYGAWMEDSFDLRVAALGLASAVIGIAELGGEGLVGWLSDRMGKRRSVLIGLGLNTATCLLLPLLGDNLVAALVGLFLFYITFEFSVVSMIPLMTELAPDARATLMAGSIAAFTAGRAIGAIAGALIFEYGLLANGVVAAGLNVVGIVLLILFIKVV